MHGRQSLARLVKAQCFGLPLAQKMAGHTVMSEFLPRGKAALDLGKPMIDRMPMRTSTALAIQPITLTITTSLAVNTNIITMAQGKLSTILWSRTSTITSSAIIT